MVPLYDDAQNLNESFISVIETKPDWAMFDDRLLLGVLIRKTNTNHITNLVRRHISDLISFVKREISVYRSLVLPVSKCNSRHNHPPNCRC